MGDIGLEAIEDLAASGAVQAAYAAVATIADPDCFVLMMKGRLAARLLRYGDAELAFRAALAAEPDNVHAHLELGALTRDLGLGEASLGHWQQVCRIWPHLEQPYFEIGCLRAAAGQYDLAAAALRPIRHVTNGYWVGTIGRIARQRSQLARAVSAAIRRHRACPLPAHEVVSLSRDLTRLGFCRAAQGLLATLPPGPVAEARGIAQFELSRRHGLRAAAEALADAVDPAGMAEETRYTLADAFYQARLPARAGRILAGVPLASLSPHVQELLFRVRDALGDDAGCQALADHMVAARPRDTMPYQLTLRLLISQARVQPLHGAPPAADLPIPLTLFQFWHDATVPAEVQAVSAAWRSPRLHQVMFDDAAGRRFIADTLPARHLRAYDRCHHAAMRSDFIRLCYLLCRGGIYVDVDEAPREGVGPVLDSLCGQALVACLHSGATPYANNAFLAAIPGHPVIAAALDEACRAICDGADAARPDIWETTGPGVLTRALVRHLRVRGAAGIGLLDGALWDRLVEPRHEMAYKGAAEGNWRLA